MRHELLDPGLKPVPYRAPLPLPANESQVAQEASSHPMLALQRTLGNRTTQKWLQAQMDGAFPAAGVLGLQSTTILRSPNHPTHPELEHQDPYARRHRHPDDEQTIDWADQVQSRPPSNPYLVPALDPGAACPFPPHAVVEQEATHHAKVEDSLPDPFRDQHTDDTIVQPWWLGERQKAWDLYRAAALQVQAQAEGVAPDINLFFQAEKNEDLKALGFIMPKGYKGNLIDLSDQQRVPTRGGTTIGSLFRGDGSLNATKADQKAISSSAAAMEQGKGGVEKSFLGTTKADSDLQAQFSKVKAAIHTVEEKNKSLEAARQAIEFVNAEDEKGEAKEEIELLKQQTEAVASIIEFIVAAPEKLAALAEEGAVSPLEAVGTIANIMLNNFPSDAMQKATSKLAKAQAKMKTAKAAELQAKLESAKAALESAIDELSGQKKLLASALTVRRDVYNDAGAAAGSVAKGSAESRQKVAGILAAIPIVESVVAALGNISQKTSKVRPPYSPEAGLGYGIALSHQSSRAVELPNAIGVLEYSHLWFDTILGEWETRLKTLNGVKERIGGTRPGD